MMVYNTKKPKNWVAIAIKLGPATIIKTHCCQWETFKWNGSALFGSTRRCKHYANMPECYVLWTLPIFILEFHHGMNIVFWFWGFFHSVWSEFTDVSEAAVVTTFTYPVQTGSRAVFETSPVNSLHTLYWRFKRAFETLWVPPSLTKWRWDPQRFPKHS
jgi:hypothetical protein